MGKFSDMVGSYPVYISNVVHYERPHEGRASSNLLKCHTNTHVPAYLINIRLILMAPEEKLLPTARVVKSPVLLTVRCSPAPPP